MSYFKTVVGHPAEGSHYFSRPRLNSRFWKYIQSGSHILVSAPRRIGKTSFLRHVCEQGMDGYRVKYHTTESINQGNEYFKRLYKSLLEELSTNDGLWNKISDLLKRNRIEKFGLKGIEIKQEDLNYFEEYKLLLQKVEFDQPWVFIIDEFSETLVNINKDFGESAGQLFLHQNRELRQDPVLGKKVQYVYSGSVGLDNIAERMGASKTINDLRDFKMPVLTEPEAMEMIAQSKTDATVQLGDEVTRHLLAKVHHLVPFYLMILLDQLEEVLLDADTKVATREHADEAFKQALEVRTYFEHWSTRLRITFTGNEFTYAKDVLNQAANDMEGLAKGKAYDLAMKYDLPESYASILRSLEYDGYLVRNDQGTFHFQSPLLKAWWLKNISV